MAKIETFPIGVPEAIPDRPLYGLAYAGGPSVLYTHGFADAPDLPPSPVRWALQGFTPAGDVRGDAIFLADDYLNDPGWGAALAVWNGELLAAYRQSRYDDRFAPLGYDTYVAKVGTDVVRSGPLHSMAEVPDEGGDVAVAAGLVVTGAPSGLLVGAVDGLAAPFTLATERPQVFEIAAAALGPERAVVIWSEDHEEGLPRELATQGAIVSKDSALAQVRVFEPSPFAGDATVIAVGPDIWIARFDSDAQHLRESRIRVARLDDSLERIEADRWFSGWGGLVPAGLALVTWQGVPWLVWRTLDARFGADMVLYVRPIPEPVCGYDVSDPASVWRAGPLVNNLVATASDDALWVAVPYVQAPGTADLYEISSCE